MPYSGRAGVYLAGLTVAIAKARRESSELAETRRRIETPENTGTEPDEPRGPRAETRGEQRDVCNSNIYNRSE